MSETPRQLSDDERVALKRQLTTKSGSLRSETLGYKVRGQQQTEGAVVSQIPSSLADAELSVCGVKGFMIDETRKFHRDDGTSEVIDCAHVAALEMVDSPSHVHGRTTEFYQIVSGTGKMVLGEEVISVGPGSVIRLPPGLEHGLVSDDPQVPVKALLTFIPGLAPKTNPEFRDEAILCERTSTRIQQLLASGK